MVCMFNELSLEKVKSRDVACEIMETFVRAYLKAKEIGFEEIRLHQDSVPSLFEISICDNYSINAWLLDKRIDEDLRIRFKEIVTNSPLITDDEITHSELYNRSDFFKLLDGVRHTVWGLGASYIHQTLACSLNTHAEWRKSEVQINHYYLTSTAEEKVEDVITKNFAIDANLDDHIDWYEDLRKKSLQASRELWEKRREFFPYIELCEEIEGQLKKIGVSKALFQIIDRLQTLNKYAQSWTEGDFSYEDANEKTNLRISTESDSTLNKFGSLRRFNIPELGRQLFDLHIKTGNLRFHFYPHNDSKKIYVGYIGKHLRISSQG